MKMNSLALWSGGRSNSESVTTSAFCMPVIAMSSRAMFRTKPSRAQRAPRCWTSSLRCERIGKSSSAQTPRRATGLKEFAGGTDVPRRGTLPSPGQRWVALGSSTQGDGRNKSGLAATPCLRDRPRQVGRIDAEAQQSLLPDSCALDADPRRDEDALLRRAVIDDIEVRRLQPGAIQGAVDAQRARHQPW